MNKWDIRMLQLAAFVATWSKDPKAQVGCVLTDTHNRILGIGYNGFPRGASDDHRLDVKEEKLKIVIHAEENAILNSNGSLNDSVAFITRPPCLHCCGMLKQVGVTKVVFEEPKPEFASRWNLGETVEYLKELDIEVSSYRRVDA